ncbi:MAG: cyclic nucleotide-binding domain-containing protein [Bacteroidetes bacterium]|nr:cyclic nucleotide-binding domain-containing protein [Bacteroidota bacterium]
MAEIIEILKKVDIFKEMESHFLEEIAGVLEEVNVKRQQNIIKKGDPGDAMYIIGEGQVRIHDGNHVLSRLSEYNVFGEYSLIDDEVRSASVTAEKQSILYKLNRNDFDKLVARNKDITRGILRVLIQRIRYMNELEEKLARSYIKIQKQKAEIEEQSENLRIQKQKFEEQNFELLNINEEKNNLIGVVVHGLKNPLTSCLTIVDLLYADEENCNGEQREYLDLIRRSLFRMNKMINEILDVNIIESRVLQLKITKINLRSIVSDILGNHRLAMEQLGLELVEEMDDIFADLNEVYILQVVDNLISNAIRFTPSGKKIHVLVLKKGKAARLVIKDEGVGIPSHMTEAVFDLYQQKKSMLSQDEPDPGLGLAIVKKYVTAMAGKVWCESSEGKGSSFIVEFPLSAS